MRSEVGGSLNLKNVLLKVRQHQCLVIVSQCVDEWLQRVWHEAEVLYLRLHDPNVDLAQQLRNH